MRKYVDIATVLIPGQGLIIGRLCYDHWLEYVTNAPEPVWKRIRVPKVEDWGNRPQSLSLAVDAKGTLTATVLYDKGDIKSTELAPYPAWKTVQQPKWDQM